MSAIAIEICAVIAVCASVSVTAHACYIKLKERRLTARLQVETEQLGAALAKEVQEAIGGKVKVHLKEMPVATEREHGGVVVKETPQGFEVLGRFGKPIKGAAAEALIAKSTGIPVEQLIALRTLREVRSMIDASLREIESSIERSPRR